MSTRKRLEAIELIRLADHAGQIKVLTELMARQDARIRNLEAQPMLAEQLAPLAQVGLSAAGELGGLLTRIETLLDERLPKSDPAGAGNHVASVRVRVSPGSVECDTPGLQRHHPPGDSADHLVEVAVPGEGEAVEQVGRDGQAFPELNAAGIDGASVFKGDGCLDYHDDSSSPVGEGVPAPDDLTVVEGAAGGALASFSSAPPGSGITGARP